MKKSTIIYLMAVFLYAVSLIGSHAQVFHTTQSSSDSVQVSWIRHYSGPDSTYSGHRLAVDKSGNVYVTGININMFENGYYTVKYNSDGMEEWSAHYLGPEKSALEPIAMALDSSGNVYITGNSYSSDSTRGDYGTVKYDPNGVELWSAIYNGPDNSYEQPRGIAVDDSGNVHVTGFSFVTPSSHDYVTVKYNTDGVEQWIARYNGPADYEDHANAITLDNSGNVYVTGTSTGIGTGHDFATVKYTTDGVEKWVARFDDSSLNDGVSSIALDDSGNVYVSGGSQGSNTDMDYVIIKYNSDGIEQWVARYNGPGDDGLGNSEDNAGGIGVDQSGNVYLTGRSLGTGTGLDFATVKYNSDGVEQWVARYNGPGNGSDSPNHLEVDGSGCVYVTGRSWGSGTRSDFATIKYDTDGIEQWIMRFNGPKNLDDGSLDLALDDSGNVYVTGYTYIYYNYRSTFTTIKYSQGPLVSVENEENHTPDDYWLFQNYPNPFNPETKIVYSLPIKNHVTLKVYNLLGEEIKSLVNEQQDPGKYEIVWNGSDFSSGIYLYRLKAGNFIGTKKMMLQK